MFTAFTATIFAATQVFDTNSAAKVLVRAAAALPKVSSIGKTLGSGGRGPLDIGNEMAEMN